MQNIQFKNWLKLFAKTFSTQIGLEILDIKTLLTMDFPLFILYFFYFYLLFFRYLLANLVDCFHWFVWFFRDIPEKRPVDTSKPWTTEELVAVYLIWVPVIPFTAMSLFIYFIYLIGCFFFMVEPNAVALQDLTSLPSTDVTNEVSNSISESTKEVSNSISESTKEPAKFSFDWRAFENNNRLYRLNMERMARSMEIQREIRARNNLLNGENHHFRGW